MGDFREMAKILAILLPEKISIFQNMGVLYIIFKHLTCGFQIYYLLREIFKTSENLEI